ncbi:MAG: hypothetical protein BWK76_00340 [Desulfobulbaceae bacterium A2]|nr:MAG: hypothetical protein BWK76_00340 [Desulfobulbaceae bacterium A2]
MAGNPGSKVTADLKKNRLIITVSAAASQKEAQKIYTDIRFCVADLKPGFDVITDFSRCSLAHLSAIATMRQIMDYLIAKQPGTIIRVVGKNSLVFKQLLQFVNKFQSYKPFYADTLAEAEEILAGLTQRNGLCYQLHDHLVEYTCEQEKGQGKLVDISINGCTVQEPTIPLSLEQELLMVIPIDHGDGLPASFSAAARVARVKDDLVTVEFLDLSDEQKTELNQWFAYEVRQDKSSRQ